MSIGHFAYQPATAGVQAPGFQALLGLMRDGNTWMKISGANRVSATDLPPYDDVKPMAHALIEAAPERIMWGTDWPHPNKYVVNPNDGDLVDCVRRLGARRGDAPEDHGRHAGGVLPVLIPARLYKTLHTGEAPDTGPPQIAVSELSLAAKEPIMSDVSNTPTPPRGNQPAPARTAVDEAAALPGYW